MRHFVRFPRPHLDFRMFRGGCLECTYFYHAQWLYLTFKEL